MAKFGIGTYVLVRLLIGLILVIGLVWLFLTRPIIFGNEMRPLAVPVDTAALETHVRKLSQEFVPRDWRHPANLDRAADYIAQEFRRSNAQVSFQPFLVSGKEYRNVISEYNGDPTAETVVIGAHYDADGEFPGADDNASGVAALIELGRLVSKLRPAIHAILVAYSLEEMPFFGGALMGSAVHASSLVQAGRKIRLMISLEMIGYFSDRAGSQTYPISPLAWLYPSRGNFLAIVGAFNFSPATVALKKAFLQTSQMPVLSINAPRSVPGVDFSDHRSYWDRGFDAVMITDTAFFRNSAYHTVSDTAESLDYEKMAEVVTGVYSYLHGTAVGR